MQWMQKKVVAKGLGRWLVFILGRLRNRRSAKETYSEKAKIREKKKKKKNTTKLLDNAPLLAAAARRFPEGPAHPHNIYIDGFLDVALQQYFFVLPENQTCQAVKTRNIAKLKGASPQPYVGPAHSAMSPHAYIREIAINMRSRQYALVLRGWIFGPPAGTDVDLSSLSLWRLARPGFPPRNRN